MRRLTKRRYGVVCELVVVVVVVPGWPGIGAIGAVAGDIDGSGAGAVVVS